MPYWNKIFLADELEQRILDNYDVTETYEKEVIDNTTQTSNGVVSSTNENTRIRGRKDGELLHRTFFNL